MSEKYLKIEGDQFVKDVRTKAVLAVNRSILMQNEARKKLGQKINGKDDEINNLKRKVDEITGDISDIKEMLKTLLQNKD
jgi:ACT domain-containing protein